MSIDQIQELARTWLTSASALGWGVEGPEHATLVADVIEGLAQEGRAKPQPLGRMLEAVADRTLGARPVDALHEAAALIAEASTSPQRRRAELLASARGWLEIASR